MSWSPTELDAVATLLRDALEQPHQLATVESALAALAGSPATPRPELARLAAELRDARPHEPAGLLALPVLVWARADGHLPPSEPPDDPTWPTALTHWRRCHDLARLVAAGVQLPLLSTPTSADLTVHATELHHRVDAWRAAHRPLDEVDLTIALHRVRGALSDPSTLPADPALQLVRLALGDLRARRWDLPDALLREALTLHHEPDLLPPQFDPTRPACPATLTLRAAPAALAPTDLRPLLTLQATHARYATPEHDPMPAPRIAWSAALCPRHPAPFAAWTFLRLWEGRDELRDDAVTSALHLLKLLPGPLGPWGARAVLAGLAAAHPEHRDAAITLAHSALAAHRLHSHDLARALHEQLTTKAVLPERYVPGLRAVAAHSPHHLRCTQEVLQGALKGSSASVHRKVEALITLWQTLHTEAGKPPLSVSNRDFLDSLSPSSRAGRAAQELLAAVRP
jgi:hypothetical protein